MVGALDEVQKGVVAAGIKAITLMVEDLDTTKSFYREVLGLPVTFEDADSPAVHRRCRRRVRTRGPRRHSRRTGGPR